ncbi:MAG TPA: hypothetical protein GXZ87_07670 [Bacteroidales bacterium]|nr:hypothetical protein [Bacteroidales bacterium]
MTDSETKLAAANLLLQRGVRFRVDAPFFIRLLQHDFIEIKPLYAGTIVELSRIVLEDGLENLTRQQANEKISSVCRLIATAMLNGKKKLKKVDRLAKRLEKRIPAYSLFEIYIHINNVNQQVDFSIITDYFSRQMNLMMTRKLPGQNQKGS